MAENGSKGFFDAPPKTTFVMGVLTGLVVASIVGGVFFLARGESTVTSDTNNVEGEKVAGAEAGNEAAQPTDARLSASNIAKYATELKLDTDKFNKCLNDEEKTNKVSADQKRGAELGVQGTPATFVNGYLVSGALPFEEFKGIIDEVLAGKKPSSQYVEAGEPAKIEVTSDDNVIGSDNAKVTLVEYSDFECPFCQRHVPTVQKLLAEYGDQIRVVYRHFPLSFHANAQIAAEAAECAGDQGEFWGMHDKLFGV